eukprot:1843605-Amphidinium_carterae.1
MEIPAQAQKQLCRCLQERSHASPESQWQRPDYSEAKGEYHGLFASTNCFLAPAHAEAVLEPFYPKDSVGFSAGGEPLL